MLNPEMFCAELQRHHISFFCGVPDSLLKYFCYVLQKKESECRCIVTANEGNAVALAAGHFIASGEIPCVFMQNSGLGNAVNPLLSLADPEVYSIPMLIVIGWRGRPGVGDEPQHLRQGKLTLPLIRTMKYPFAILPKEEEKVKPCLDRLLGKIRKKASPGFLLVQEKKFSAIGAAKGGVFCGKFQGGDAGKSSGGSFAGEFFYLHNREIIPGVMGNPGEKAADSCP